jgi:hypothetical protein
MVHSPYALIRSDPPAIGATLRQGEVWGAGAISDRPAHGIIHTVAASRPLRTAKSATDDQGPSALTLGAGTLFYKFHA